MDDFEKQIEHLMESARIVQLSHTEKEEMRRALRFYVAENPARERPRFFHSFTYMSFRPFAAALVLILIIGTGTSYAAQSALPGDVLYPIKTNINEAVEGAFSTSAASQAQWNATLATRRLEEAETLASEGRLSPVAQSEIETQFSAHAADFDNAVATLKKTPEDIATVADVQSDLEASLNAHAAILSDLSASSTVDGVVQPILAQVKQRAESVSRDREATDAKISNDDSSSIKIAANQKKLVAEAKVTRNRSKTNAKVVPTAAPMAFSAMAKNVNASSTDASSTPAVSADDESSAQAYEDGQLKLQQGQYGQAFTNFQAVIRKAQEARVQLDARQRLHFGGTFISNDNSDEGGDIHTDSDK